MVTRWDVGRLLNTNLGFLGTLSVIFDMGRPGYLDSAAFLL